jgi:hypothetical protein
MQLISHVAPPSARKRLLEATGVGACRFDDEAHEHAPAIEFLGA